MTVRSNSTTRTKGALNYINGQHSIQYRSFRCKYGLHDHLAGVDILAWFRADGGNHAVEIGLEFGVVKLVASKVEIGPGGSQLGLAPLRALRLYKRGLRGADVGFR